MDNTGQDRDLAFEEGFEKVLLYIEEKKYFRARDELVKFNPVDIAELLEDITGETDIKTTVILFRLLPKNISVEVFAVDRKSVV